MIRPVYTVSFLCRIQPIDVHIEAQSAGTLHRPSFLSVPASAVGLAAHWMWNIISNREISSLARVYLYAFRMPPE